MSTLTVQIYEKEKEAVQNCITKLIKFASRFQRKYKIVLPLQELKLLATTQEGIQKSRFIFYTDNERKDREVIVFLPELTTPKSICKDIRRAFKRNESHAQILETEQDIFENTAKEF